MTNNVKRKSLPSVIRTTSNILLEARHIALGKLGEKFPEKLARLDVLVEKVSEQKKIYTRASLIAGDRGSRTRVSSSRLPLCFGSRG